MYSTRYSGDNEYCDGDSACSAGSGCCVVSTIQPHDLEPPPARPTTPPRSCWVLFPDGCPSQPSFNPRTDAWLRDTWGEANAEATTEQGCAERAGNYHNWCGITSVLAHYVVGFSPATTPAPTVVATLAPTPVATVAPTAAPTAAPTQSYPPPSPSPPLPSSPSPASPPPPAAPWLALLSASMSSTLSNAHFSGHDFSANACIDGVWGGGSAQWSFCHSDLQADAWLSVRVGESARISRVLLYGRSDCCQEHLGRYEVWVGDTPGVLPTRDGRASRCQADDELLAPPTVGPFSVNCALSGSFVTLLLVSRA